MNRSSAYWQGRADEALIIAGKCKDPKAMEQMLDCVAHYQCLMLNAIKQEMFGEQQPVALL